MTFSLLFIQKYFCVFLVSNESHIFLIANLKFRLQTPCNSEISESFKFSGKQNKKQFLMYFLTPNVAYILLPLERVNKKVPQSETS